MCGLKQQQFIFLVLGLEVWNAPSEDSREESVLSSFWLLVAPNNSWLFFFGWQVQKPISASIFIWPAYFPVYIYLHLSFPLLIKNTVLTLGPTLNQYNLFFTNYICKGPIFQIRSYSEVPSGHWFWIKHHSIQYMTH